MVFMVNKSIGHHVNLADVLSVSKPTETELILHSFPWFGPKNEVRMSRYVRLKCKNEEERNVWVHRVQSLLSPSPFTPGKLIWSIKQQTENPKP